MGKVNLALFGLLIHREIDDPRETEAVGFRQAQFAANLVAGLACERLEGIRLAAQKEGRIAKAKAQLQADRFGAFWPDVLCQGAGGFHARPILGLTPEDIAHAGQTLFLGKGVHPVTELAAAALGRGNGAHFGALLFQQFGEDGKARTSEMLCHDLHLDRVAQIGLV